MGIAPYNRSWISRNSLEAMPSRRLEHYLARTARLKTVSTPALYAQMTTPVPYTLGLLYMGPGKFYSTAKGTIIRTAELCDFNSGPATISHRLSADVQRIGLTQLGVEIFAVCTSLWNSTVQADADCSDKLSFSPPVNILRQLIPVRLSLGGNPPKSIYSKISGSYQYLLLFDLQ